MKVLLSGVGVDDSRRAVWMTLRRSLETAGHRVAIFDHLDAERFKMRKPASTQLDWVFETFRPDIAVLVPAGEGDDEFVTRAQTSGVRVLVLAVPESSVSRKGAVSVEAGIDHDLLQRRVERTTPFDTHDVLLVGRVSGRRVDLANELLAAGIDVGFCGLGWDDLDDFASRATSTPPGAYFPDVLRSCKCVVVTASDDVLAEDVGPIHTALIAAGSGVALVAEPGAGVEEYLPQFICEPDRLIATVSETVVSETVRTERITVGQHRVVQFDWAPRWAQLLAPAPSFEIRVRKDGPKVSYLNAAYQIEDYIGPSIESLLDQTFDDIEIIVTIDGATDKSASVVRKYLGDRRVRMIEQPNVGQTGRFDWIFARLHTYRGDYLALQGGDDVSRPDRTSRSLDVFTADPGASVVHGAGELIDKTGNVFGKTWELDFSYDESSLLRREIKGNAVASPTMFVRRSLFDEIGFLSGGFATDYEFWTRAARVARFRYIPDVLTSYRIHDSNASVGANVSNTVDFGLATRLYERERTSIVDLYPGLAHARRDDTAAWVAAYVDLGNGHMQYLVAPEAALGEYERALSFGITGDLARVVHHGRAIAFERLGDHASAAVARAEAGPLGIDVNQMIDARAISTTPFVLPADVARRTIAWDGTPASRKRMLLIPDWNNVETSWPFLDEYFRRCSPNDDVDLVLPTLGFSTDDVVGRLLALLPSSVDLENCAALTVERWDDLSFVPPDRFSGVVNLLDGLGNTGKMEILKQGL